MLLFSFGVLVYVEEASKLEGKLILFFDRCAEIVLQVKLIISVFSNCPIEKTRASYENSEKAG